MPSSRPYHIPTVVDLIKAVQPKSILDVGVGYGKMGHLFREYTDIVASESDPSRYQKANWAVTIDGIEGFEPYLTEMHAHLYDRIIVGVLPEALGQLDHNYDFIFLGDIIEHFDKATGILVIKSLLKRCNRCLVISTPARETFQQESCSNDLETHRSIWKLQDLGSFGPAIAKYIRGDLLLGCIITDSNMEEPIESAFRKNSGLMESSWLTVQHKCRSVRDGLLRQVRKVVVKH